MTKSSAPTSTIAWFFPSVTIARAVRLSPTCASSSTAANAIGINTMRIIELKGRADRPLQDDSSPPTVYEGESPPLANPAICCSMRVAREHCGRGADELSRRYCSARWRAQRSSHHDRLAARGCGRLIRELAGPDALAGSLVGGRRTFFARAGAQRRDAAVAFEHPLW